ncbi:MAG TPA: M14 family metallopeptidase [Gemmatimonadales bacterium]|nr:M14 family metallopeptidase [Gemmatimonadales bacterium]
MTPRFCTSLLVLVALASGLLVGQTTRPERTNAQQTSSYQDVLSFLDSLERAGADLRVGTLAQSVEGRWIPWVLAAKPMVDDAAAAHRTRKPILYIQGNIHAGEVEGKEAAQMLLRDLTLGVLRPLLDSVIVLVVPIYNVDGNEAVGPSDRNRPGQNGPALVGRRVNGQGLDLNRDYVKMEAPETRGAAALINEWDPDFFIDLHTTNGSYHGYALTYSPGLNPNSGPPNDFVRDAFLPTIRTRMRERHGQEIFDYGNFKNQDPDSLDQGWYTYEPMPRYGVNWFAMRGRMAILSEAYSNAPFAERISATYNFVREILSLAAEQRDTLASLHGSPWRWVPDSIAVRSDYAAPHLVEVRAEITEPVGDGSHGFARRRRTGIYRSIRMPVFDRFAPVRQEALPAGYLLPPGLGHVVEVLGRHGVRVARVGEEWTGPVEAFHIDSLAGARRPFQGHRLVDVRGNWRPAAGRAVAGWFYVPTEQRLGVLAAYLLEPGSADGVAAWNFLDRDLRQGNDSPILRVRQPVVIPLLEPPTWRPAP